MVSTESVRADIGRQGETGYTGTHVAVAYFQMATTPATYMPATRCIALTLVFSSKRPLGVSIMILGGLNGYSAGNKILK